MWLTDLLLDEAFRHWLYWTIFMMVFLGIGRPVIKEVLSYTNKNETHYHYDGKGDKEKKG